MNTKRNTIPVFAVWRALFQNPAHDPIARYMTRRLTAMRGSSCFLNVLSYIMVLFIATFLVLGFYMVVAGDSASADRWFGASSSIFSAVLTLYLALLTLMLVVRLAVGGATLQNRMDRDLVMLTTLPKTTLVLAQVTALRWLVSPLLVQLLIWQALAVALSFSNAILDYHNREGIFLFLVEREFLPTHWYILRNLPVVFFMFAIPLIETATSGMVSLAVSSRRLGAAGSVTFSIAVIFFLRSVSLLLGMLIALLLNDPTMSNVSPTAFGFLCLCVALPLISMFWTWLPLSISTTVAATPADNLFAVAVLVTWAIVGLLYFVIPLLVSWRLVPAAADAMEHPL